MSSNECGRNRYKVEPCPKNFLPPFRQAIELNTWRTLFSAIQFPSEPYEIAWKEAAREGHVELLRYLHSKSEVICTHEAQEFTADRLKLLNEALLPVSNLGHHHALLTLLEFGADPNYVDSGGYTPLYVSTLCDLKECVFALLDYGGDVEHVYEEGKTLAMHAASREGDFAVFAEILRRTSQSVHQKSDNGWGLVHYAVAFKNSSRQLSHILDLGGNIAMRSNDNDSTLHHASEYGNSACMDLIIKKDKSLVNSCNSYQRTPIHVLGRSCRDYVKADPLQCLRILIRNGANVNALDEFGNTPLMRLVCWQGSRNSNLPQQGMKYVLAVAKALLANGATVDAVDGDGFSALDLAKLSMKRILSSARVHNRPESLTRGDGMYFDVLDKTVTLLMGNGAKSGKSL